MKRFIDQPIKLSLFSLIAIIFVGCAATVDPNLNLTTENSENSKLIIYRPRNKLVGVAAIPHIGTDAGYFAEIENGQYIEVPIDSGTQTLLSKYVFYPAKELTVNLIPETTHCVKVVYNYSTSIGFNTSNRSTTVGGSGKGIEMLETECPSAKELNQLTKIEIGHTFDYEANRR